jgi:hypothetical protein
MPHPVVYGRMYWVCILNPSEATFQAVVQPLLAEAYKLDVARHAKKRPVNKSQPWPLQTPECFFNRPGCIPEPKNQQILADGLP